jgi:hypothetical protein
LLLLCFYNFALLLVSLALEVETKTEEKFGRFGKDENLGAS